MKGTFIRRLVTSTIIAGVPFVAAGHLRAQSLPPVADDEEFSAQVQPDEGSGIVVTGSRIPRRDIEAIVPIAVIDSTDIERDAATNVQDILREFPQVNVGASRTNTNFSVSGNGVATLDLRGLGATRTLVLVNGRRHIAGFAGSSSVDVNNIPTDFLSRVEVVTGGASALYGSDAVAGVVNFILKDRFEGISARAQYGITEQGDNPRYLLGLTGGTTLLDGRIRAMGHVSHDRDSGLRSADRALSRQDCGALRPNSGGVITPETYCGPQAYSVFSPQGQFHFNIRGTGPSPVVENANVANFSFNPVDNALIVGANGPGFNRNAERYIAVPVERYLAGAIISADISDRLEWFAEGTYAMVRSNSSLEPAAIGIGLISAADVTSAINIDNPFLPDPIRATIAARNSDADPANDVVSLSARRRFNEVFDRSNRNDRDTFRAATGFRGDLSDQWRYEASYVYGSFRDYTESESALRARIANAVDAIRLPSGQIVCRSEAARAEGCAPLNLFGAGTASPEASRYVTGGAIKSLEIRNQQHVVTAQVAGTPFSLWAGDVGVAAGVEYRHESGVGDWDAFTNAGTNIGNITNDLRGSYDVREAFAEVNIPLLRDTFVHHFGIMGAGRVSDYSTIGTVFSWNIGAEFAPVRDLRFRTVYARANRAPNIADLFTPPNETFAPITDPCNGTTATNNPGGLYGDVCRAIPGVAAAIRDRGIFEYTLAEQQSINGFVGGNPDLTEERAKTFTLGAVFTPSFIRGLSLTADYYDIKLSDAISTVGRLFSVQQCLLTADPVFCQSVLRDGTTGKLVTVNANLVNVAAIETQGVDLGVRYSTAIGSDLLSLAFNMNYLIDYKTKANPISAPVQFRGQAGFNRHRGTGRIAYTSGAFTGSWQSTFMSRAVSSVIFSNTNPALVEMNNIRAYTYHDAQVRWDLDGERRYSFYVGVDNVLNSKPPFLPNPPFSNSPIGLETQGDIYDPFGRRFYAGVRVGF